ncbi:MAG: GNAT family N-acetyltransferase [Planctomycetaceae bacterium]|nr:GNAT family N-acetyltransferase [Planctomycetaceae bacterium]
MECKLKRIEGVSLALRLVTLEDAKYIHSLRVNPVHNRHLSPVLGDEQDQSNWIKQYKAREADCMEYYYIIECLANAEPCGLIRLYDIRDLEFTWGSWILDENKPKKAALESAMLSFLVGFDLLKKKKALIEVSKKNLHAVAFYRRFNMKEAGSSATRLHFEFTAERFFSDLSRYNDILELERPAL